MEKEEIKNGCGCNGGCDAACERKMPWGAAIASEAIERMTPPKDDAKSFIEACRSEGKDPIDVVRFITMDADINLCGNAEDNDERELQALLREVIRILVEEKENDEKKDPEPNGSKPDYDKYFDELDEIIAKQKKDAEAGKFNCRRSIKFGDREIPINLCTAGRACLVYSVKW